MIEKFHYVRSKKARNSARGEDCTMGSPWCNHDPQTTVLCHSNESKHGKGKGIKASDVYTFYGCSGCHKWYDEGPGSKENKQEFFWVAWWRTQRRYREKGIMEVVFEDNSTVPAPDVEQDAVHGIMEQKENDETDTRISIHVHSVRKRLTDPDGISAKAAIDGLVLAGLLPDDSPKYIKEVSYSQKKGFPEETIITLTSITDRKG